jgi:hypothetical protein
MSELLIILGKILDAFLSHQIALIILYYSQSDFILIDKCIQVACFPRAMFHFFYFAVTFIISSLPSDCMQDIVSSKKMENGIVVFWDEKGEKKNESFNYIELVDMKINALDLLERPKSYKVDKAAHRLIVKK